MHLLYSLVENLAGRACLTFIDVLAIVPYSLLRKRGAHQAQKLSGFLVGISGGNKNNIHTAYLVDFIIFDFRENQLFLNTHGVVTTAVEGVGVDNQIESIPIELKKVQLSDGQWAYYYHDPGYKIPSKVDERLPMMKRMRLESEHSIIIRFVPHGNPRKILDITVVLVPDKNPQGQTGWNVWHQFGSKEAFIKFHNDNWSKLPNCEHLLLREEDFD